MKEILSVLYQMIFAPAVTVGGAFCICNRFGLGWAVGFMALAALSHFVFLGLTHKGDWIV